MSIEFHVAPSTKIKDVLIITPNKFSDSRGDIWSIFQKESFNNLLPKGLEFVLDKCTISKQNVLRGIHGDYKSYKLVTCLWGEILQVVVDCRKDSATYLQYEKFSIDSNNPKLFLLPPYIGNAYYVKSKEAVYFYKWAYNGKYVDIDEQFTYAWNDERICIDWGINNPILSNRDMQSTNHKSGV